jgi:hypothetical protein
MTNREKTIVGRNLLVESEAELYSQIHSASTEKSGGVYWVEPRKRW